MHQVILVNDNRAQNNWGCRASTIALIDLIDSARKKVRDTPTATCHVYSKVKIW